MKTIIACIDNSGQKQSVCDGTAWVAQRLHKPVLLLHTLEKQPQHETDSLSGAIGLGAQDELLKEMTELDAQRSKLALKLGKALLADAADKLQAQGVTDIEQKQQHGDLVEALLDLQKDARLVVLGRSGESHQEQFKALGSHIESLLRQITSPVMITPPEFTAPSNFMLAYDGRATADQAVERIISGGLLKGMTCHLVSVQNKETTLKTKFEQTVTRLEAEGFEVVPRYLEGEIFATLQTYQRENQIELLVMGAFAHSKLRQLFLGSNTLRMIESAGIPLIVLK